MRAVALSQLTGLPVDTKLEKPHQIFKVETTQGCAIDWFAVMFQRCPGRWSLIESTAVFVCEPSQAE